MLYVKNVPNWERFFRIVLSVITTIIAYEYVGLSITGLLVIGSALIFLVTGFVGWCPMCAMVGQKLEREKRERA